MAPTHDTTSLQLNLSDLGVVMPFTFFQNSHRHIVRILNGETYPLIADIGPVSTILDIGANVGAATVMLAARYPRASIHSFEPGPDAGALLARNVAALANVRIHPFGLADHDEQCKLYRSTWDPMSASVLPSVENTAAFDVVHLRRASDAIGEIGIASAEGIEPVAPTAYPFLQALGRPPMFSLFDLPGIRIPRAVEVIDAGAPIEGTPRWSLLARGTRAHVTA